MFRFLPWRFIVRRAARAYGMADPALWLARIRSFVQPSEVAEPIELLRAGVLFHARGIVNTKAIQHNLDWVWPYWVQRQFDPTDVSFIPRAFSFSHVNLTHRNWTAIGLPELSIYPIVDPRGLVTPVQDGWSIDFWLIDSQGRMLIPSQLQDVAVRQELRIDDAVAAPKRGAPEDVAAARGLARGAAATEAPVGPEATPRPGGARAYRSGEALQGFAATAGNAGVGGLSVATTSRAHGMVLQSEASVLLSDGQPTVNVDIDAWSAGGGTLVASIRPYNPEGVQFIDHIDARQQHDGWRVNDRLEVVTDRPADQVLASDYARGDVFSLLADATGRSVEPEEHTEVNCGVGMATAAAVFKFDGDATRLRVCVPLHKELATLGNAATFNPQVTWAAIRSHVAKLCVPDDQVKLLYDAAVQTLILLSADEIVPGPYTYRRFWFRDACLMMNSLLAIGLVERCRRAIERFPARQLRNGYFRSQEGEWDSNGQVLWILDRFAALSGEPLPDGMLAAMDRAVTWIDRKRVRDDGDPLNAGLLPAGFSAEHLGPNDHYYWDDFWAEAGLRAAERINQRLGRRDAAADARAKADDLRRAIDRSIERTPAWRTLGGIPASPHRRIDAGAIGSLVADYPLQLYPAGAPRIMATAEWLLQRCMLHGGFFQDMIHSGINAYLTLGIAQTLLRAEDARYRHLVEAVARLASPTGQWPEAIHPQSGGGCMGDGQHGWAAAEWVMMIRNMFVREEGERLIIGSGLFSEWLETDNELSFGPTLTPWGAVSVAIRNAITAPEATVEVRPVGAGGVQFPGAERAQAASAEGEAVLRPETSPARNAPARRYVELAIPGFERIARAPVNESIRLRRTAGVANVAPGLESQVAYAARSQP